MAKISTDIYYISDFETQYKSKARNNYRRNCKLNVSGCAKDSRYTWIYAYDLGISCHYWHSNIFSLATIRICSFSRTWYYATHDPNQWLSWQADSFFTSELLLIIMKIWIVSLIQERPLVCIDVSLRISFLCIFSNFFSNFIVYFSLSR